MFRKKNDKSQKFSKKVAASVMAAFAMEIVLAVIYVIFIYFMSYVSFCRKSLKDHCVSSAESLSWTIESYKNIVEILAMNRSLWDSSFDAGEKHRTVMPLVRNYEFESAFILDRDGACALDGTYHGNQNYFVGAMAGSTYIADPIPASFKKTPVVTIASPIWKNGRKGGVVEGVLCCRLKLTVLNMNLGKFVMTPGSGIYIIDSDGSPIAGYNLDSTRRLVKGSSRSGMENDGRNVSKIEKNIRSGLSGCELIISSMEAHFFSYTPVPGTSGWVMIIHTPLRDLAKASFVVIFIFVFGAVCFTMIAVKLSVALGDKFGLSLKSLSVMFRNSRNSRTAFEKDRVVRSAEEQEIIDSGKNLLSRLEFFEDKLYKVTENVLLSNVLNIKVLDSVCNFCTESSMDDVILRVSDRDGRILLGTDEYSAGEKRFEKYAVPVTIDGRDAGSVEVQYDNISQDAEDKVKNSVDAIARILSDLASSAFKIRKSVDASILEKNEAIKKYYILNEKMKESLKKWMANSSVALKDGNPSLIADRLEYLIKAARQLLDEVEEAIDFSYMTSLNLELEECDYSVDDLMEGSKSLLSTLVDGDGPVLEINVMPKTPERFFGSRERISMVLSRIVANCHIMNPGNVVCINISTEKFGYSDVLEFVVFSRGVSLKSEDYYRIKTLISVGSALASSMDNLSDEDLRFTSAVRILQMMSGTIEIYEEGIRGTYFKIRIPQLETSSLLSSVKNGEGK